MLTGESLEQLHADVSRIASEIRELLTASSARSRQHTEAEQWLDVSFENGKQSAFVYTLAKLERAIEESH